MQTATKIRVVTAFVGRKLTEMETSSKIRGILSDDQVNVIQLIGFQLSFMRTLLSSYATFQLTK